MHLGDKLVELLGHSIEYPSLKQIFSNLKLIKDFDFGTASYLVRSYKSELTPKDEFDIVVKSINLKDFIKKYGEVKFASNPKGNEQIFFEFTLNHQDNKELMQNISLPFGLQYGDDSDTIIQKMGQKPNEKFSYDKIYTDDRHKEKNGYWFNFDEYTVLTALDADFKLVWIRCHLLEMQVKKLRDLKKQLKQENKNIKPENKNIVAEMHNHLPTKDWRVRMSEGDGMFSEKAIEDIETELKLFVERVMMAMEKKNATTIHGAIKKLVLVINKLNIKHNYVVETMEREELCLFIEKTIKGAGFFSTNQVDFTEEWREW